jgi:hypothetical protein
MSEVAQQTSQEFWRPPVPVVTDEVLVREAAPLMAEACRRCGTEFLLGSRFCHTCGGKRPASISAEAQADAAEMASLWERAVGSVRLRVAGMPTKASRIWDNIQLPSWLHYLHFHEIKSWAGLSTGSLIAFIIGVACVAGALLVGLLTAKTLVDWQAIQFYRAEWLLGATASFVAGILLKKPSGRDPE